MLANYRVIHKFLKNITSKKVLLRERKRHTASRVASARYAALSRGDTPFQVWGGYPGQVLMVGRGYPIPGLRWGGYPIPGWGVPQSGLDGGRYPIPVLGGTPSQGGGYPSQVLMVGGYPIQT